MPRIDVAVTYSDGTVEVVNAGRPAVLVAFGDEHGKAAPETPREVAWLVHRALDVKKPLTEWLEELDDLDASDEAVESAYKAGATRPTKAKSGSK